MTRRQHAANVLSISSCHTRSTRLFATEKESLDEFLAKEKEELQQESDMLTKTPPQQGFGFNPNNFDRSALPVPLFTGLVIMGLSLYMTGYFLYVGLNGFPENDTFPRPF
eukprot:CAMPEP_0202508460 /NCGR_PEP_ID=MMETSP1361-20130828/52262_1 /ASSEMBLY_ACC=CAM_ASM_000849 /TAXON_ID=210615 /ORGANISM="Staurosira complex sp., Strain CCMP2646" /LENGTH=109 /DNA_ID=CAMNT_0049142633 /DNA_START=111 /DNA_END=440 /DNA_ORIENTATION=-